MNPSDDPNVSTQLDALRNRDELCDAFEQQLCRGETPTLARYLEQVEPSQRAKLIPELLALTRHHLSESAMRAQLKEYLEQFPERSHTIIDILREETLSAAATSFQLDPSSAKLNSGLGPGEVFGKFEIEEEIARGGMGVIFKARQQDLDRVVALKVIITGHLASEEEIKRFQREARSVAALEHPNIVSIYEVDQVEQFHYFTMKFIEGHDLDDWNTAQPRTLRERLKVLVQLCEGIDYAHRQEIIHRDLKPGNILVNREGRVKIIDFGLAKKLSGLRTAITGEQLIGTPLYMSPEQLLGDASAAGPRSDVYAIGAVMYELLTGQKPFAANTLFELMQKVATEEAPRPTDLNPDLPPAIDQIILPCLAKDPAQRCASPAEIAQSLRSLRRKPGSGKSKMAVARRPAVSRQTVSRPRQTNRWLWGALAGAGLLVFVVGGLAWYNLPWPSLAKAPEENYALPDRPEGVPPGGGSLDRIDPGPIQPGGSDPLVLDPGPAMPKHLGFPSPRFSAPLQTDGPTVIDNVAMGGDGLFLYLELKLATPSFEFYQSKNNLDYPTVAEARADPSRITPELDALIRGQFDIPCQWVVTDSAGKTLASGQAPLAWNQNEATFAPETWNRDEKQVDVWAIFPLGDVDAPAAVDQTVSVSLQLEPDSRYGSTITEGELLVYPADPLPFGK